MRVILLPLVFLGLAACSVGVHEHAAQPAASTTVVQPAPQATYVAPAAPSSTTVIRSP